MPDKKTEHNDADTKSTVVALGAAVVLAVIATAAISYLPGFLNKNGVDGGSLIQAVTSSGDTSADKGAQVAQKWEASAPGRVEPKGGKVQIRPETSGLVVEVLAAVNDRVKAGDPLAILKSDEIRAKLDAARAEVAVRVAERDEEPEKSALVLERRKADDAVAAAQRKLFQAHEEFDRLFLAHRSGDATDAQVETAREAIPAAEKAIAAERAKRTTVLAKAGMPKPTRLDSGLQIARSDLRVAELTYERTRVRAPMDGTILRVDATVGEGTGPSAPAPLFVMGDMTALEIVAEVDERDVSRVSGGQAVVIRSNAFTGKDFGGKVVLVQPALGSPMLKARGPSKPSDVDVLEVKIALDGPTPLMPGMRVDVFFKPTPPVKAAAN